MTRLICFSVMLMIISTPLYVYGETRTLDAQYTYKLDDRDTKSEAERYCFIKAKQKLESDIEIYLQNEAGRGNYPFTFQDIKNFSFYLLKIEPDQVKWKVEDGEPALAMRLKTVVDTDYLAARMNRIQKDPELKAKIIKDKERRGILIKKVFDLRKKSQKEKGSALEDLVKKKQVVWREMDRLEKIKYLISSKTKLADRKIHVGMTMDEVADVAGQPRTTARCEYPDFLNYGNVWVWIENGIVKAKIPGRKWKGPCYGYDKQGEAEAQESALAKKPVKKEKDRFKIVLKNGHAVPTPTYYEIDNVIYYKKFGGIIGIEKSKIKEIKKLK